MPSPKRERGAGKAVIKQGKMELTSEISEINRLSVGIQELNHRVVAVLDAAADGGDVPLHHCHVLGHQILAITFRERAKMKQQNQGRCRQVSSGNKKLLRCRTPSGGSAKTSWDFYPTSLGKGLHLLQGNRGPAVGERSRAHRGPAPSNHQPQSLSKRLSQPGAGENLPAGGRANQRCRGARSSPQAALATAEPRSSDWRGARRRRQRGKASGGHALLLAEAVSPQHTLSAAFSRAAEGRGRGTGPPGRPAPPALSHAQGSRFPSHGGVGERQEFAALSRIDSVRSP